MSIDSEDATGNDYITVANISASDLKNNITKIRAHACPKAIFLSRRCFFVTCVALCARLAADSGERISMEVEF